MLPMKNLYIALIAFFISVSSFGQLNNFSAGDVVPDFTITDLDGNQHSLYEYTAAGKYVLIDFYTYWCGPCMATAPTVVEFYHTYGCNQGDVIVLGVEGDGSNAQAHEFEVSAGVDNDDPYPCASGTEGGGGSVHSVYGVAAFPTIVAVGPNNVLLDNDIWPIASIQTLVDAFPTSTINEMACFVNVQETEEVVADVRMFPNPANDIVSFAFATNESNDVFSVSVFDAMGKLVLSSSNINSLLDGNLFRLNVSELAAGVYSVHVNQNTNTLFSDRLIIQ
jgi:thiol-disulfide isomerase/thioredoxin